MMFIKKHLGYEYPMANAASLERFPNSATVGFLQVVPHKNCTEDKGLFCVENIHISNTAVWQ